MTPLSTKKRRSSLSSATHSVPHDRWTPTPCNRSRDSDRALHHRYRILHDTPALTPPSYIEPPTFVRSVKHVDK
ncbi:unnamed protein product [Cylicocyclus nassatus]|uniref:Uncharacterized protein n=1 Tax=Cylicocyclus nassatus TaxID=53992 RepID=A0AA36HEH1_CYLNA|nr:unnamed protein product [Cylicocyclus nassatus]